jgi:hypothetical protein
MVHPPQIYDKLSNPAQALERDFNTASMLLQGLTITGSELSSEIKMVGLATSALITLVRVSDWKSQDGITHLFSDFVEKSRKTAVELQKSR